MEAGDGCCRPKETDDDPGAFGISTVRWWPR
jgi:hypothetical protein